VGMAGRKRQKPDGVTGLIAGAIGDRQKAQAQNQPLEAGAQSYRLRTTRTATRSAWPRFLQVARREWWMRPASGRPSSGPASSSMPMAWPTWIALGRSRLRQSCSHARTPGVMTRT
jgi:hypothetical protein